MSNVTIIPARKKTNLNNPIPIADVRKVAGYARVSTDHDEQLTSYEAQVDYYTNYINKHDDWEFAGIYTDEGITATSTKRRKGFNQMVEDALAGKIDLIITKSVSRFARNTVDSLTTIRKLKEHGIEIYFEKENIWTLDSKGELLITLMSSMAQEESRNISENVKWGHRKRYADGKVSVSYGQFLGYEKGEDGKMVVNPEQAKVVKYIYGRFLEGMSYHAIANKLTEMGIPTPGGKTQWRQAVVKSILMNEKYKGDALLQKSYVVDFLTRKSKKNEGEIPQYYVENDHEAIITPEQFQEVQDEIARRDAKGPSYSGASLFASKIVCGECGSWYGSKVWHSNDRYRRVIYRCNHKYDNGKKCSTPHVTEDEIKDGFVKAVNILLGDREDVLENAKLIKTTVDVTDRLGQERDEALQEMEIVAGLIEKCISENSRKAQDQKAYEKRYQKLADRYEKAREKSETLTVQLAETQRRLREIDRFIKGLEDAYIIESFDETMWRTLIQQVTVYAKDDIHYIFKDGQEIRL